MQDIKELDQNDNRFMVLNGSSLGKFVLLDPKLYIRDKENLEKICNYSLNF